jgi:small conductance mechanosensitive channel
MDLQAMLATAQAWVMTYAVKLVVALLVLFIGKWIARKITDGVVAVMDRRQMDPTLINFIEGLLYYVLLAAVVIAAAGQLGIETTSFLAILGAAGLAVGLALKDSLSNFASGVMLVLFRPFRVGDAVNAGGVTGKVQAITIFNTILHTPDNQRIIVPNSKITSDVITNITANDTRRVDLVMGIGYEDDIDKAKAILEKIVTEHPKVLKSPAPTIAVSELADSSVNFVVRPWTKTEDYWDVYFDLTESIKKAFDAEGISIPYPQQDVHLFMEKGAGEAKAAA